MKVKRNTGFDRRIFLTAAEWDTFCRRKPVRYIRKSKERVCQVCGLPATPGNPLQNAHIISFDVGVIDLALTPDLSRFGYQYRRALIGISATRRPNWIYSVRRSILAPRESRNCQRSSHDSSMNLGIESHNKEEIADGKRDDCLSRQRDDETHRSREPAG